MELDIESNLTQRFDLMPHRGLDNANNAGFENNDLCLRLVDGVLQAAFKHYY